MSKNYANTRVHCRYFLLVHVILHETSRPRDHDNYTWSLALLRVRPARLAARAILETAVGVLGSGPDLKRVQSVGRAVVLCQVLDNFNLEGDLSDDG